MSTYLYVALTVRFVKWVFFLNNWVFVYELSDCGFEFRWGHFIFSYHAYAKSSLTFSQLQNVDSL